MYISTCHTLVTEKNKMIEINFFFIPVKMDMEISLSFLQYFSRPLSNLIIMILLHCNIEISKKKTPLSSPHFL